MTLYPPLKVEILKLELDITMERKNVILSNRVGGSSDDRSPSPVFELVGRAARLACCRRVWKLILCCRRTYIGLIKLIISV